MQQTATLTRPYDVLANSNGIGVCESDLRKSSLGAPTRPAPATTSDVMTRIDEALRATGYPNLRGLSISGAEGLVILRGKVPTYYLKQVAQTIVLKVVGVTELQNELEVMTNPQVVQSVDSFESSQGHWQGRHRRPETSE